MTAAASAAEIGLSPSLVLAQKVLRARNQYHQSNSLLIVERLAADNLHLLGSGATLVHSCPLFVNFATLLLDACEHRDLQQSDEPWPMRRKQHLRWAAQAVSALGNITGFLRYAKCYHHLLFGRLCLLEKKFQAARNQWTLALGMCSVLCSVLSSPHFSLVCCVFAEEAKAKQMQHVQALAEFELGVHPTNTPDSAAQQHEHMERAYALCKALRLDCRNDPHLVPLGRRAELDPLYPTFPRRDAAMLQASAEAAAAEIAAGITVTKLPVGLLSFFLIYSIGLLNAQWMPLFLFSIHSGGDQVFLWQWQ